MTVRNMEAQTNRGVKSVKRSIAVLVVFVVMLSAEAALPAPVGSYSVSLFAPAGLDAGQPGTFAGSVKMDGLPMIAHRVDLLVNGVVKGGQDTAAPNGTYSIALSFSAPGDYVVEAVVHKGTQLESRSEARVVHVGPYTLTIIKAGTGTGVVTSSPAGISCGATCSAMFSYGQHVTLSASAAAGSTFTGWSACGSSPTCTVAMKAARSVTATFADLAAPNTPLLISTTPGSPANYNVPLVKGAAEAGATARLWTSPVCGGAQAGSAVVGPNGAFSISASVADDSTTTFYATATDAAGNVSSCSSGLTYVEDSSTNVPALIGTTPGSPANNNTPTVIGTAPVGDAVFLYANASCMGSPVGSGRANDGTFAIVAAVADNTTTTFAATAQDELGNVSGCSPGLVFREDSTAPLPPTIGGTTPMSPANNNNPSVTGTSEASTMVKIFTGTTCTGAPAGSGHTVGGSFSVPVTVADDSDTQFSGVAVDAAGNASLCAAAVRYVEDSTAPAAPVLSSTTPSSPANNHSPRINGTTDAATGVRLYAWSACWGNPAATAISNATGSFSVLASVADNSSTTFYASAIDGAGNVSACSNARGYVEDSTPPLGLLSTTATGLGPDTIRLTWNAASDAVTPASKLVYDICRSTTYNACADGYVVTQTTAPGRTSIDVTSLSSTTRYYFVVLARDQAGNRRASITSSEEISAKTLGDRATVAVAGGTSHSCSLLSDGTVRCWGDNFAGQLGNATTTSSLKPVVVSGLSSAVAVATDGNHSCALLSDGTARCWGYNGYGQLGNGTTTSSSTPVPVGGLAGAVAIAVGDYHSCAVRSDGAALCWGYNGYGQLGNGTTTNSSTMVLVNGLLNVSSIAAGTSHSCAVRTDGQARCWGRNNYGQLGDNSTTSSSIPVTVSGLREAEEIATDGSHSCAVLADGTVNCWGANGSGQLGNGTTTRSRTPVAVSGLTGAVAIATGDFHSCALRSSGTARCWGFNGSGQLGNGTTISSSTPVVPSGLFGASAIAVGDHHSCALRADGTPRCWGYNNRGQLGTGSTMNSSTPVAVSATFGREGGIAIAAGEEHTCAALSDGTARCWGANYNGQLGNGTNTYSPLPVAVSGLSGVVSVAAGGYAEGGVQTHSCALLSDATARCWGSNGWGQLGNGESLNESSTPVVVSGLSGAVAIAAGAAHTCALLSDGSVRCWGENRVGQLGDGSKVERSTPVVVSGLSDAVAIATGKWHTCALISNGTARCWGWGIRGQLGNGSTADSTTPVTVTAISGAVAIAAGEGHSCAVLSNGTARCWGYNFAGQLGNGTTVDTTTPVSVGGLSGAVSIDLGYYHSCAVLSNGTARCWGHNYYEELGDGSTTNSSSPVVVSGLSGAVAITADNLGSCVLLSDGGARCWGATANMYEDLNDVVAFP